MRPPRAVERLRDAAGRRRAGWRRGWVRTPALLQMEAAECGAACLGIVLAHFGRWVAIEELRLACGVSRNGSRASNMLRAAERYGLRAQAFRSEPASLARMRPPMILHWNFNHFVVLEGFSRGRVHLNDPAVGRVTVGERELDESFTGVVLTCEPGPRFTPAGRRQPFLAALAGRLEVGWSLAGFVLLTGLALVVLRLASPAFAKIFLDRVLLGGDAGWLAPLLLAMAAAALLLGGFTLLQQRFLLQLEGRLAVDGSSRLVWHVLHLPVEFFAQRFAGDIASRLTVSHRMAELLSRDLAANVLSAVLIFLFAALMLRYDAGLTVVAVAAAMLNVLALHYFSRRRTDGHRRLQQEQGKLQGAVMGGIELIETAKGTGAESDLFVRWAGYQAKVVHLRQQLERHTQLLEAVPPLLAALSTAAVLGIGGRRVLAGDLTPGELLAFQVLLAAFLAPVTRLVSLGARLQTAQGDVQRLDDVLRHPLQPGLDAAPAPGEAAPAKLSGRVELRGVTFGYDRSGPPLIENLDLTLRPGDRIALVGVSGSGKSTIARLVMGLYEPWCGEVRFDGVPRARWPRSVLQASVASVDQRIVLFEGTVRENLTLWDDTVGLEEVVTAARDAAIHHEILARPGGYESRVERDGRNWSGGQRQRLEIARALVGRPPVLVLDEATSALDPVTEQQIDANLRRRGCSCLILAHRLSTIRDAAEILVLDRGRVVQRGTHEELLREGGLYARLIAREA